MIGVDATGTPISAFTQPGALARDFNGDLMLLENGESVSQIYRLIGTDGSTLGASAVTFGNALNGALEDAPAMIIDGNRDPLVVLPVLEPVRLDGLTGAATTLTVGGVFTDASDILVETLPEPGRPVDDDSDGIPDGFDP